MKNLVIFLCYFIVLLFFNYRLDAGLKDKSYVKMICKKKEKELKNCFLKFDNYKIQINKNHILLSDGVWRSIHDLPIQGKDTNWESLRIKKIGSHVFLEIKIWGKAQSILEIQSLNWFLLEINKKKLNKKISEIIQKRKLREEGKPLIDPIEKYGLKLMRNGKIKWWAGSQKGIIDGI